MAKILPKKGRERAVKKVMLVLDEELHHKMKVRATEERKTVVAFIAEAIQQALEKGGKKE